MDDIADKAEVLLVGEIVEISAVEKIDADKTRWNTPLLRLAAKIRVLRAFKGSGAHAIQQEKQIVLVYEVADWERGGGVSDGPFFREFAVGDVFAFPLRRATDEEAGKRQPAWRLIDEEDNGLVIPAQKEQLQDVRETTGVGFLQSELASAFASRNYGTIFKAADYLSRAHVSTKATQAVFNLVEATVKEDQDQWLEIATAAYCALPIPRPRIIVAERAKWDAVRFGGGVNFFFQSLDRVHSEKCVEQLIAVAIKYSDFHEWGTGVTIGLNDPRHVISAPLLRKKLEAGDSSALFIAHYTIKEKDDPLTPDAIKAARNFAEKAKVKFAYSLTPATELILMFGEDKDIEHLVGLMETAKKSDHQRYTMLWRSCIYASTPRVIFVARLLIDDTDLAQPNWRICDKATMLVQSESGVDFGLKYKQTTDERDVAIKKAKVWLAKNPLPAPYEIVLHGERVVFDKAESVSIQITIRNLGMRKLIAPDLYWGVSVIWDGKEYKRDPKHTGRWKWNGPGEVSPKTAWRTGFSLSEYLVPAEVLTAEPHTVALKDAFAESNTLTVFIEPKNR